MGELSPTTWALLGMLGFVAASMATLSGIAFCYELGHRRERRRNRREP